MKLIHDGKAVLALLDGEEICTEMQCFDGAAEECLGVIDGRAMDVPESIHQRLTETQADRTAVRLLAERAAIDERLAELDLSPHVAEKVVAARVDVAAAAPVERTDGKAL